MIVAHDLSSEKILFTIPTFTDERGTLSVAECLDGVLPFTPQRVFWLYDVPQGTTRGGHAHATCWEALVALQGTVEVTLRSAVAERTFVLDSPTQGLLIPPAVWCDLKQFSPDSICLCMASEPYSPEGYITEFIV